MIHDKIQNCSNDITRIMMIEKSRKNGRTPKEVFFFSKKSKTWDLKGVPFLQTKNTFLSGPVPISGYLCNWLTCHPCSCCLVDLIDVTLAGQDANSTFLDVVSVADVKECVEDSLVRLGICQVTKSMSDHKCHLCKIFLGSGKFFNN